MVCVTDVNAGAQRGRPGYSRDDVINAAVRAFNSRGYDATSMGHVAKELGITKSALYHHISSKEEILELTVAHALSNLEAVVAEVAGSGLGPGERVWSLIRGSIEVLCTDPKSVALLLRLRGNSDVEERALERRRKLTRSVVPLVRDAQEAGEIRADLDAAVLTRMVFGMVNSVAEWYDPKGKLGAEEVANSVAGLLFGGLRAK
ncbi:TetR/AcrR family transcriptional regulator [Corynebacterium striatum]|uniref:TetR/AcrR family transcriptional regulator n=1 Tax=Corynebacterium striatum TaxID=43770 RepID=A0ABC8CM47_CORST|nr:TetR/AcrR family transcriptional regulator [Corynebacterium striatum]ATZ08893.1 TetR/AcrR family transcriptional regulator [Corynebacterium striatum]EGT5612889.1 TetR/AcrR family transcriptional regulator [Corynebacterium striatum]